MHAGIPGSRRRLFEQSSHTQFEEEREFYRDTLSAWLSEHDDLVSN